MDQKKLMAWVVIILMSLSILGVVGGSFFAGDATAYGKEVYNGYTFYGQQNQWRLQLDNQEVYFFNFPRDLESIEIPFETNPWSIAEKIYLTYLPTDDLLVDQNIQFTGAILRYLKIKIQRACVEEEGCPDIPIMDCEEKQGIIFRSGKEAKISQKDGCLVIEAIDGQDLQKLTERVIYDLLGVM